MSQTDHSDEKPRFNLRDLFAFTFLVVVSMALINVGIHSRVAIAKFGILAGALVMLATLLLVGVKLSARRGALTRIFIAIILICLLMTPLLFPAVR